MLMYQYQKDIYWHIRRMVSHHEDADDVVQNTFVKAFRFLDGFKGDCKIYTWLYRIATNESISHLAKRKKQQTISLDIQDSQWHQSLKAEKYFDGNEVQKKLVEALEKIPPKQKVVFSMRYYDNLSYKEMAEIFQTSVGALKASYHHAVKKIENYLRNEA